MTAKVKMMRGMFIAEEFRGCRRHLPRHQERGKHLTPQIRLWVAAKWAGPCVLAAGGLLWFAAKQSPLHLRPKKTKLARPCTLRATFTSPVLRASGINVPVTPGTNNFYRVIFNTQQVDRAVCLWVISTALRFGAMLEALDREKDIANHRR